MQNLDAGERGRGRGPGSATFVSLRAVDLVSSRKGSSFSKAVGSACSWASPCSAHHSPGDAICQNRQFHLWPQNQRSDASFGQCGLS